MADNDLMEDDEIQEQADDSMQSKKKGLGFLKVLIKWIVIALVALIVIVTVVVITMNIMDRKGRNHSEYPISEEYREDRDILEWYESIQKVSVKTADRIPATVAVKVALGYTTGDKNTPQELSARKVELIDFLRKYFKNKTAAELKQETKIQIEIKNEINDNILTKNKIRDVRFTQYDIIEQ